ncbi:MAG TPA: PIG-L deacetylase family protein [Chthoniobacterales bacterium]|jgi:LmbE family N-acetylglucosaminyl deacetylase
MLAFKPAHAPRQILLLGAHSDDIEIGCGGTVLRLVEMYPDALFIWVVFCSTEERAKEAHASAEAFLGKEVLRDIRIFTFRDGFLPWLGVEVKEAFEKIKIDTAPDLIFTHSRDDRHQDHRTLCDLTWNTWRDHAILEYEIPKYDGDLGQPNAFMPLTPKQAATKVEYLMEFFGTQRSKRWFTPETFRALMRIRGIEAGSEMAEAFYTRKILLS